MPFLLSSSGNRKKKSNIHDGMEPDESLVRSEMVKQKLYRAHMMGEDDDSDAYLQLRLGPASPRKQKGQHHHRPHRHLHRGSSKSNLDKTKQLDRRSSAPNYIDHSGSLVHRKPPTRSLSETTGRPASSKRLRGTAPPLQPKRVQSARRISPKGSGELPLPSTSPNGVANARFSATPGRGNKCLSQTTQKSVKMLLSPESESESSDGVPSPIPPKRPPPRRRRATVTTQALQQSADAVMRFGPPRKVKSYYPGANKPRNSNFHMNPVQTTQKSVKILLSPSPRDSPKTYNNCDDVDFHEGPADEVDENESESSDDVPSPIPPRRPHPRSRRATVATQSLQQSADAVMRFGPPRKVKSYYPGANKPKNKNFHMKTIDKNESLDISNHSNKGGKGSFRRGGIFTIDKNESLDISNHSNKGGKGSFRRGGLFRRKSGDSDGTEDTASSSDRSSSFFRPVRKTNSASMKRSMSSLKPLSSLKPTLKRNNTSTPLLSSFTSKSNHSAGSQNSRFTSGGNSNHSTGSQNSRFTSGGNSLNSAPPELQSDRRKNVMYKSAVQRAKARQAMKLNRIHPNSSEQLSELPSSTAEGKAEYDFIIQDDNKGDKGIFSSLISKIEDIYDDCS